MDVLLILIVLSSCVASVGGLTVMYTKATTTTTTTAKRATTTTTTTNSKAGTLPPAVMTTTTSTTIERIVPPSMWPMIVAPTPDAKVPQSERPYFSSYALFRNACAKYPSFGTHPDETIAKRELAAFFANLKQETHYVLNREESCMQQSCDWIADPKRSSACQGTWQRCGYYGRGPIQLTHFYNYKSASETLFKDDRLVINPDLVAQNAEVGWLTAMHFWFTSGIHDQITSSRTSKFNLTIRKINGVLECDKVTPGGLNRVKYFKEYCKMFGVEPGPEADLTCW